VSRVIRRASLKTKDRKAAQCQDKKITEKATKLGGSMQHVAI